MKSLTEFLQTMQLINLESSFYSSNGISLLLSLFRLF